MVVSSCCQDQQSSGTSASAPKGTERKDQTSPEAALLPQDQVPPCPGNAVKDYLQQNS